ncbi:MAG: hypothetical protein ACSHX7_03885 [Luteolibacter sp.]
MLSIFSKHALAGLFVVFLANMVCADEFVAPTDRDPVFQREKLPIDVEAMRVLSESLVTVTKDPLNLAEKRRAAAQAIALALALDPGNSGARNVLQKLTKGQELKKPEGWELSLAKARLWQYQSWLGSAEAGQDGNLLADLTGDAMSVLDADHPKAVALRKDPEKGNWEGWVAGLDDFKVKEKPKPKEEIAAVKEESGGDPFDMPEDPPKTSEKDFLLKQANLRTALWKWSANTEKSQDGSSPGRVFRPEAMSVIMRANTNDAGGAFQIKIKESEGKGFKAKNMVSKPIVDALKARHGSLPKNGEIVLNVGSGRSYTLFRNGGNLTGPGFILADAAITGKKPEALVVAALDGEGKLGLAKDFWRLLMAMKSETGRKIVLPAEAEEYLVGLLTLENVDFFLNNEVLLASSNDEFIALCAQKPSEAIAPVREKFDEIREKSEGNEAGAYLANRYVRQRLEEIANEAPYHVSAKLLAVQGSGRRPPMLSEKILASEIWRIIVPVSAEVKVDFPNRVSSNETINGLKEKSEDLRVKLDAVERYTDLRNRELFNEAVDVATSLRDISRALDGRGEYFEKYSEASKEQLKLRSGYKQLMKKLEKIVGANLPVDNEGS